MRNGSHIADRRPKYESKLKALETNVSSGQPRLVIFDMDGTLVRPRSSWRFMHKKAGTWKEARRNVGRFEKGEITWSEWAQLDAALWKGIPEARAVHYFDRCQLMPGAFELASFLRSRKIATAIVSGGISILARRLARELGIEYVFSNSLSVHDGLLTGEVEVSVRDDNKADFVHDIASRTSIEPEFIAAVGDDFTMMPVFRVVGCSIAFNPENEKVAHEASHQIHEGTLLAIKNLIVNPTPRNERGRTRTSQSS